MSGPASDRPAIPTGPTTPAERRRAFRVLFMALVCVGMGQTVVFIVIPPIARSLHVSEVYIAIMFASSATIWAFMNPFWGRLSDSWGRKPVIIVGLSGFGVSMALVGLAAQAGLAGLTGVLATFALMTAGRWIFSVLGPGTINGAQAYVADRTSRAERTAAVAALNAAFTLGASSGPGLAAGLVLIGLLAPFYLVAAIALASAVCIYIYLPERSPPRGRPQGPRLSVFDRRVRLLVLGMSISASGHAVTVQSAGFYIIDVLGMAVESSPQFAGVALMAASFAGIVAQLVLVQRFDLQPGTLMRAGVACQILGFALLLATDQYGPFVLALMCQGLGVGMARPGHAAAGSLAFSPHEQGAAAGIMNAAAASGWVVGPLIGMPLYQYDPQLTYWAMLVLLGALMVLMLVSPAFRVTVRAAGLEEDIDQAPKG
ncbi:MAG: MFS transporter [Thalassobaculales bacterium]